METFACCTGQSHCQRFVHCKQLKRKQNVARIPIQFLFVPVVEQVGSPDSPPPSRDPLEKELFYQCLLYSGALYTHWTMYVLSQVENLQYNRILWITIESITPLQGFCNLLIYVRLKMASSYREWRLRRWNRWKEKQKPTLQLLITLTKSTVSKI